MLKMIVMCFRYTEIKVPIKTIVSMINDCDIDNDGCISIGELIKVLKKQYAILKRKRA